MKKIYNILLCALLIAILQFPYSMNGMQQISSAELKFAYIDNQIQPYKDVIEWIYKKIGNKWYRRQYNASTGEWIGKWELVN